MYKSLQQHKETNKTLPGIKELDHFPGKKLGKIADRLRQRAENTDKNIIGFEENSIGWEKQFAAACHQRKKRSVQDGVIQTILDFLFLCRQLFFKNLH